MDASELRASLAPGLRLLRTLEQLDADAEAVIMEQSQIGALQRKREELAGESEQIRAQHATLRKGLADLDDALVQRKDQVQEAEGRLRSLASEQELFVSQSADKLAKARDDHNAALVADLRQHEEAVRSLKEQHAQLDRELLLKKAALAEFHKTLETTAAR